MFMVANSYLVMEHVEDSDDIGMALTQLEQLDLASAVEAATHDLHRVLDARLHVTALSTKKLVRNK